MLARRNALLHVFLAIPVAYLLAFVGFPIVYNVVMSVQEVTLAFAADWVSRQMNTLYLSEPSALPALMVQMGAYSPTKILAPFSRLTAWSSMPAKLSSK